MKKEFFLQCALSPIVLVMFFSIASGQTLDIPIANEVPRRGIYRSFEEFKLNRPGITDSFYVDFKVRDQVKWKNTLSFTPIYAINDKKVKKVWGFSDGKNAFKYHSEEFFQIILDTTQIGFYSYGEVDQTGLGIAAVAGGLIGGAVYSTAANIQARGKRIYYEINPINGKLNSPFTFEKLSETLDQMTKVVIYRNGKKEFKEPINLLIQDTLSIQLLPNSVFEYEVPIARIPFTLCYGEGYGQCLELLMIDDKTTYVQCAYPQNTGQMTIEKVPLEVGEFYAKKASYFQNKRLQEE